MENQYLDSNLDQEKAAYANYGSFLRRFAAAFIDGILLSVVSQIIQSVTGIGTRMQEHILDDPEDMAGLISIAGPIWGVGFVIQLVYFAYFESSEKQATFGKMALGLVVTDENGDRITFGKAAIRYLARIISSIILFIGYLIQPFTAKKQALHDMIAGTLVFKK